MKRFLTLVLSAAMLASLAGCSSKNPVKTVEVDETKSADVVIVGAGGAGLSAAIEAVENGAESVILVEKTNTTGGSLNFTGGTMSGAETIIQQIDGIEDTKQSYIDDIMSNGDNKGDIDMITAYVNEDVDAIQWLWDNGLKDKKFSVDRQTGTMSVFAPEHQLYSVKRSYKPAASDPTKYKSAVHEILDTVLATKENVTVDYATTATELLNNEKGQVLSVIAKTADGKTVRYDANKGVIMATGGYSGNSKLMGAFAENGSNYLLGGSDGADGYGIYMMQQVGAYIDPVAMSYIPTFPMGLDTGKGPGKIASSYMWKCGAISVNQNGERFVDETEDNVVTRESALEVQPNAIQYDIFTDNIIADVEAKNASVFWNFYYAPGKPYNSFVVTADSIEELAEKLDMPAETLEKTIADYNAHVESGEADEFGREFTEDSFDGTYSVSANKVEGDKYYAIPLKALCVMTLGGVKTNTSAQVLDANGTVIPGLYAAGECVGGIWGKYVSGGTGVMGPVVFGRIAARTAMTSELADKYKMQTPGTTITADMFEKDEPEAPVADRYNDVAAAKDGEYTATVDGQEGEMTVKVTIANGAITAVEIVENHETQSVAGKALEEIPAKIVENNSCNVDGTAGATLTSGRIMDAVSKCLEEAAK